MCDKFPRITEAIIFRGKVAFFFGVAIFLAQFVMAPAPVDAVELLVVVGRELLVFWALLVFYVLLNLPTAIYVSRTMPLKLQIHFCKQFDC